MENNVDILLSGHSGCVIKKHFSTSLNRDVVIKKSSSIDYNLRLKNQMEKQITFLKNGYNVPEVYDFGFDSNGLFYFEMEYVSGISMNDYLKTINATNIESFVDLIIEFIKPEYSRSSSEEYDKIYCIFIDKVVSIKQKVPEVFLSDKRVKRAFHILENYDWSDFCESRCHGDLTLENVIVKDGDLFFIDFLDSFYNCWIIDAAKILQDVYCLWSFREDDVLSANVLVKMGIFYSLFIDKISSINELLVKDIFAVLLLNILRILQYNNNKRTELFLLEQIEKILLILGDC